MKKNIEDKLKKYALISVSDKTGIIEFAKELNSFGYTILATGNTAKLLIENNLDCKKIENFTGFPEIFEGRVKTLHPLIFGGILMRRENDEDIKQAEENNVAPIDIVCVNLYPFPEVYKNPKFSLSEKIENIDIGGPSLIRAASKNYNYVSVLTDPSQYNEFIIELRKGSVSIEMKQELAAAAFSYTSYYDTLIANYLEETFLLPNKYFRLNQPIYKELRYGENPHQKAFLYGDIDEYLEILMGKEISYNNIIDVIAAVNLANDLKNFGCAIIKHTNPCGAAESDNLLDAYLKALSCDPKSAFGGIVAFNHEVDADTASKLNEIFLEVVCAPAFSDEALKILSSKKNRRIVKVLKNFNSTEKYEFKNIPGGVIVQDKDLSELDLTKIDWVTDVKGDKDLLDELRFAWTISKHTKSNTIIFSKHKTAIGVGAGQMSRIDSVKIAASKAEENGFDLKGAVVASDAFFPFEDGILELAKYNISAVIQPGGSIRDNEVIKAANDHSLAMAFTGIRNFKH